MATLKTSKQTKSSSEIPKIIDCKDFKSEKLSFSDLDTKKLPNQFLSFPYYEAIPNVKRNFIYKTGQIKSHNTAYHK